MLIIFRLQMKPTPLTLTDTFIIKQVRWTFHSSNFFIVHGQNLRIKITMVSKVSKGMGIHKLLKRKTDASEKTVFGSWLLACIPDLGANSPSPESSLGLSHYFPWLCMLLDLNFYLKKVLWKDFFFSPLPEISTILRLLKNAFLKNSWCHSTSFAIP